MTIPSSSPCHFVSWVPLFSRKREKTSGVILSFNDVLSMRGYMRRPHGSHEASLLVEYGEAGQSASVARFER